MIAFLKRLFAPHTRCRCCNTEIEHGGYGIAMLGSGFCARCATLILRKS